MSIRKLLPMLAIAACMAFIPTSELRADGSWGSGGSSGGSFGSSGGSWGCRGGMLSGRRPVRNLLSRIGNRASFGGGSSGSFGSGGSSGSNGGSLGSSGGSFGSRGGLFGRRNYGSYGSGGSNGSSGGSNGSSGGYRYGSSGGYTSTYASSFVGNVSSSPVLATAQSTYSTPTSYSVPANMNGSFMMEQSYPVGDYGFQPGYPVYQSQPGSNMIGGSTIQGAYGGTINNGNYGVDGAIPNGGSIGSIDSMLEGNSYYNPTPGTIPSEAAPASGTATPSGDTPSGGVSPGVDEADGTSLPVKSLDRTVLNLSVPAEAKVYINDQLTRTPGTLRSYESKNLDPNREYQYQIKAELIREGKTMVRTQMVTLQPGIDRLVKLDFAKPPVTTLALYVPDDATVVLRGTKTSLTGAERKFVTTNLPDGKICTDYKIEVAYMNNGKMVTDVKTIDLTAGDMKSFTFGQSSNSEIADADSTEPARIAAR